jgi:hypothetical protein
MREAEAKHRTANTPCFSCAAQCPQPVASYQDEPMTPAAAKGAPHSWHSLS